MIKYLATIWETVSTLLTGMGVTWRHMLAIRRDNVTLQYPEERWPRPERDIGFDHNKYNVIRSRLHVDIDDCIGCLKCERACPVDCINFIDNSNEEELRNNLRVPALNLDQDLLVSDKLIQTQRVMVKDEDICLHCGLCAERCPTGAWDMQTYLYEEAKIY